MLFLCCQRYQGQVIMKFLKGNITIYDQHNILIFGEMFLLATLKHHLDVIYDTADFVVILERGSG